jgi:hypothetical protein
VTKFALITGQPTTHEVVHIPKGCARVAKRMVRCCGARAVDSITLFGGGDW